jgi:hypothetical protein
MSLILTLSQLRRSSGRNEDVGPADAASLTRRKSRGLVATSYEYVLAVILLACIPAFDLIRLVNHQPSPIKEFSR